MRLKRDARHVEPWLAKKRPRTADALGVVGGRCLLQPEWEKSVHKSVWPMGGGLLGGMVKRQVGSRPSAAMADEPWRRQVLGRSHWKRERHEAWWLGGHMGAVFGWHCAGDRQGTAVSDRRLAASASLLVWPTRDRLA